MPENPTPRQTLSTLLQGTPPPRPLLLPIVFSLGAKIENTPRRVFLNNATKISNSLRQIRTHLRSDGVACYFDPHLEMEALGAKLVWHEDSQPPTITWPQPAAKGTLPGNLRSPEDAAKTPRAKVAVEVITRLKSLFRDEPLLMAGVTGPFTLAARLTQLDQNEAARPEDLPAAAIELAASAITSLSSAFVEAGAHVLFIQEEFLPALAPETCESWASLLAPTFNIIRFYEALPVLHLRDATSFAKNAALIFNHPWDCILCPAFGAISDRAPEKIPASSPARFGIAIPPDLFQSESVTEARLLESSKRTIAGSNPVLLTTTGDIPITTDLKRLINAMEAFSRTG
ncbi:MAG: uroporphyrinogen decarboxylase family protein [Candidatus Acidiferrales bacterium]